MMGLPYGEEIMIVGRTVWTQSTSVTDGQTDRQTNRITITDTVQPRASHGKSYCSIPHYMLRRLKRFEYLKDSIKFQDLLDRYDEDLFISMSKTHHCLYHILPPARHLDSLRERGHPFSLPDFSTNIHKKSFVVRTLYNLI